MSMTIWAGKGDKVRFDTTEAGFQPEAEKIFEQLVLGKIYTVERVVVNTGTTVVYVLDGKTPKGPFNSVFFEDILVDEERAEARLAYYSSNGFNCLPLDTAFGRYSKI